MDVRKPYAICIFGFVDVRMPYAICIFGFVDVRKPDAICIFGCVDLRKPYAITPNEAERVQWSPGSQALGPGLKARLMIREGRYRVSSSV